MAFNTIELVSDLPVVQLPPIQPAEHVHHPSVCRHVSGLQLGEQNRKQFVPKCPALQATGQKKQNLQHLLHRITNGCLNITYK